MSGPAVPEILEPVFREIPNSAHRGRHLVALVCPYDGTLRGTITAGGAITIRLDPPYTQGCSRVEGDGLFTGTMRPDGTVFIQTSAAATCVGTDNRMHDGTRTVTFPWGWRFRRERLGPLRTSDSGDIR